MLLSLFGRSFDKFKVTACVWCGMTSFYDAGFDSVTGVRVETAEKYFIVEVVFGDGAEGELYYPYRVGTSSGEARIETGPQGASIRVPVVGEDGVQTGMRRRSIGLTSDVPRWVRDELCSYIEQDSRMKSELQAAHNLREIVLSI